MLSTEYFWFDLILESKALRNLTDCLAQLGKDASEFVIHCKLLLLAK